MNLHEIIHSYLMLSLEEGNRWLEGLCLDKVLVKHIKATVKGANMTLPFENPIKVTAPGIGTVTLDELEPWAQARIRQQIRRALTPAVVFSGCPTPDDAPLAVVAANEVTNEW